VSAPLLCLGISLCGGLGLLTGCETDDPCARNTAACLDLTLVGKRDDGNGGQIAYRGLTVKIFAPNEQGPSHGVLDKCDVDMTTMGPLLYGSELGPVGTLLATAEVPELTLPMPYSAAIQATVTFQLPDSFNQLVDQDDWFTTMVDMKPDSMKVDTLKALRDQDERAIRIIVTQSGQSKSAWDSRCDEAQFSDDEWLMKKWYRVGQNKYVGKIAILAGAQASPL
jgi:hypothetical protein